MSDENVESMVAMADIRLLLAKPKKNYHLAHLLVEGQMLSPGNSRGYG